MRSTLLVLILALPCSAADEVDRALYVLRTVTHAHVRPGPPPESERRKLVYDVRASCRELCGDRWLGVFWFMLAVAWKEGSVTWDWHDSGIGWGPWAIQKQEVETACDRLGITRKGCWHKFQHDRRYSVWIATEHFRELFVRNKWKPRETAMVHHKWTKWTWLHKRSYIPDILFFHEELCGESMPMRLDEKKNDGVASALLGPE